MILGWIDEARKEGARHTPCCKELGLDPRTIQRWRSQDGGDDQRNGSKTEPKNKLSRAERARVLEVVNSREFRDKSPKQIVPTLADRGEYIGSESTIYRILREISDKGTPVVINSSDAAELEGLCDKVLVMSRGHVVETLVGEDVVEAKIVAAAVQAATRADAREGGQGAMAAAPQSRWRHFVQLDNAPAVPLLIVTVLLGLFALIALP